jgi:hypothetical protein
MNKKTDKKPDALKYHYFETLLPDGKPVYLTVEENIAGKFILYSINGRLRKTANLLRSSA